MQPEITIKSDTIVISTKGHCDVIDITEQVGTSVKHSLISDGTVILFVVGSTAGLTTIEYEPGLIQDIKDSFERIAPQHAAYHHHERWGDDNGHSHVRAALLGPSITVPVINAELALGTWQQIVLVDFDTRGRQRKILVQITGK